MLLHVVRGPDEAQFFHVEPHDADTDRQLLGPQRLGDPDQHDARRRVVDRTPAERSVRQPRRVVVRADHDELGSGAERHRDVPTLGAGLLPDRLLDRERLDDERQPMAAEQRRQRVEPGLVGRRGRERARIVDERR